MTTGTDNNKRTPSPSSALVFRLKAGLFQCQRLLANVFSNKLERHRLTGYLRDEPVIGESRAHLWRTKDPSESALEAGKVHNLRIAARRLNGLEVPAGATFSFWAEIGFPGRFQGYVRGRELREGCLIPSVGGGLCQLSSALYDAALRAGLEIVERHRHSQVIPGSLGEVDRDATVFWNYVDLRFKAAAPFRIETSLTAEQIVVQVKSSSSARLPLTIAPTRSDLRITSPNGCDSCGFESCFRHIARRRAGCSFGRTAYLVDEHWPEFDRYIQSNRCAGDVLCLPIDGRRYGKENYGWETDGFFAVKQRRFGALRRSVESRRLAPQGAARQRALLKHDARFARSFASELGYDVTHVVVMQNLLPYLWRDGHLGGRTFDVLMTRFPIYSLQRRLDRAAELNPESRTLADFRADDWLIEAEREALENARTIVTPHTAIAGIFGARARLLDWAIPQAKRHPPHGSKIIFPASTLGRKGAYELRRAVRMLDLDLAVVGPQLECEGFWTGLRVSFRNYDEAWLDDAAAVVLPSFVEHKPRRLLEAVARGVPVIASRECGLSGLDGVVTVPSGDAEALARHLFDLKCARAKSAEGALAS